MSVDIPHTSSKLRVRVIFVPIAINSGIKMDLSIYLLSNIKFLNLNFENENSIRDSNYYIARI